VSARSSTINAKLRIGVSDLTQISESRGHILGSWGARLLTLAVAVAMVFRMHPYFGNMDDGGLLALAVNNSPIMFANELRGSIDTGFIRATSMIIVWPTYWLGSIAGPVWFYLANTALVFACLAVFGLAMGRLLAWKSTWLGVVFLSASLLWPYTAELFSFPSLSEKGIILGAALIFWWIAEAHRFTSPIAFWLSLVAISLFAFATKTQILVFVPGFLYALWVCRFTARGQLTKVRAIVVSGYLLLLSAVLLVLALGGSYTKGTQGPLDMSFLSDRRFQFLMLLIVLYVITLVIRVILRRNRLSDWVPAVMLVSMCGAFVLWDIRNYFLAIAGVMVGSAIATVASWARPTWQQVCLALALTISASAWLLFRLPAVYGSLASVGDFLASPIVKQLDAERATVYVSCMEAPDHYNRYAANLGLSGLTFDFLANRPTVVASDQPPGNEYIFGDARLCPWSPDSADWATVWTTGDANAFQLFASR
jgi:hypothetical protein